MMRPWSVLFAVLVLCASSAWSEGQPLAGAGKVGIGYDEGAVVRVSVLDNVNAYLGVNYFVAGADTFFRQPLNYFAFKLGGEYVLKDFGRLRAGAFGEWREELVQGETERVPGQSTIRYNQWLTNFRVGIRPEWFLLDQLSIDYKLGLQYTHVGPTFKLNEAQDGVESNKDDHDLFGLYEGRAPWSSKGSVDRGVSILLNSIVCNIGLTIYLTKLPFLGRK